MLRLTTRSSVLMIMMVIWQAQFREGDCFLTVQAEVVAYLNLTVSRTQNRCTERTSCNNTKGSLLYSQKRVTGSYNKPKPFHPSHHVSSRSITLPSNSPPNRDLQFSQAKIRIYHPSHACYMSHTSRCTLTHISLKLNVGSSQRL
jgi:hypothetical protein